MDSRTISSGLIFRWSPVDMFRKQLHLGEFCEADVGAHSPAYLRDPAHALPQSQQSRMEAPICRGPEPSCGSGLILPIPIVALTRADSTRERGRDTRRRNSVSEFVSAGLGMIVYELDRVERILTRVRDRANENARINS